MKYQDLIINNGKFIGDFEKMYQIFEDPWKQSLIKDSISRQIVINYIKKFNIKNIIEFGCGLGHTANFIQLNTGIKILGIDISKTSINKAKIKYPDLDFKVDNTNNILKYDKFQCFFFSEITWYLLENKMIDKIFESMKKELKGKFFIHNLSFYRGNQKYGNEYFKNLEEFISFCPFDNIGKVEIDLKENKTIETSSIFRI